MDKKIAKRILAYLKERVITAQDPRKLGKPLKHGLQGIWRFRVADDYRILCQIEEGKLVVIVLEIGHRKQIY